MSDPDGGTRSLEDVLADVRAFRDWVESRQLTSRRIIMAQAPERPTDRPGDVYRAPRFGATSRPRATWTTPDPNQDPMWDRWLDS